MKKQKSAILQIFYGQRGKSDMVKCAPEYLEYMHNATEYYEKLCKMLEGIPDVLELLSNYNEWTERAHVVEVDENYLEGFKFGLLIGVEAGESKYE